MTSGTSTGNFGRDFCVHAPAGSILIPNSFRVVYDSKEGARVTFKEGTITQDPFKACQFVGGSWDTMYKSRAKLNAQAVAKVLKPEPIPQALQSAMQQAFAPTRNQLTQRSITNSMIWQCP